MNERVEKLKNQSLSAKPFVDIERALLVTQAYKKYHGKYPAPILRAMVFKYLMENKTIFIGDHELIVGEKGNFPKATPTYPELCCHTSEDLETINNRPKVKYSISEKTRKIQSEEIIPFWRGKSIRDLIFEQMTPQWIDSYNAGIFTEFMEQRAPGHTVADDKIYHKGFTDFIKETEEGIKKFGSIKSSAAQKKCEQLKAMKICAQSLITFAKRHSDKALELARKEKNAKRKKELRQIAEICTYTPANAPQNFWQALQMYWFVHLGVTTELNTWDSFSPGRLDQHLFPFYEKGISDGNLTKEKAKELLGCLWVKFNNQPAPPKVGTTLLESATYTDFANINTGGLTKDGKDGVNDLTYIILDVTGEMRLLQPGTNIQVSEKNPNKFIERALEIIKKGWGQPSVFNADGVIKQLRRQGKTLADARCSGISGCVETGAFGKESYILTGYLNLPKILEITLNDGIDPRTGKRTGLNTGDPKKFFNYEQFFDAFKKQLAYFIDIKIKGSNEIEKLYADYMPAPFLSVVIDDCIKKAKDYNAGGARYITSYIQGVGTGTVTDGLAAIKEQVYGKKRISLTGLMTAIKSNFGYFENTRQILISKTAKYGNDNDFTDEVMQAVFNAFFENVDGRSNANGGHYRINMLPTTCHIYFGSVTGATPDGRRAGESLSEGISPVQGADRMGPTAVLRSASKMEQFKTGGTLLNLKFTPCLLADKKGLESIIHLIRGYFKLGGHHLQFNVVKQETLKAAQKDPQKYRDLIVRVAGYSDYFCDLSPTLQNEIISRTEHGVSKFR